MNNRGIRSNPPPPGGEGKLPLELQDPSSLTELPGIHQNIGLQHPSEIPDDSCLSIAARTEQGHLLNGKFSAEEAMTIVSDRHRPHKMWRKRYAKLLVVGDAGLGKTTLISALLSVPGQKIQSHDGTETSIDQFRRNPESMCSRISWGDEEDCVEWHYSVQDTPGYGDRVNIRHNINAMVEFVLRQNQKWFELETSRRRPADMTLIEDPRIDVCLFCLPPHRLRYMDVRFMHELGKVVPIIPIITKADTMNIREATIFRQEVHSKLQNLSQFGLRGKMGLFDFQKGTLERVGVDPSVSQFQILPFLIVASNEVNTELQAKSVYWPERQYAYGTCEAFNPSHSDLFQLRLLLVKEGLEEISAAKLQRYELWRRKRLSRLRFGFNLKVLVLSATAFSSFGLGKCIANGKPIKLIVTEAAFAVWNHLQMMSRLRPFKKEALPPTTTQKQKSMFA